MTALPTKIFNTEKTDYETPEIILGSDPGLFDTINKHYPALWKLYKTLKSQDWDENEFDYAPCNVQFKTCDKATYDMMVKTLAWQWEADSTWNALAVVRVGRIHARFGHAVTFKNIVTGLGGECAMRFGKQWCRARNE